MKKLEMKRKQQGFTIIELVVVILLLGILTATALPRFMDVTDEAHDAVVQGVLGGLQTSSGLFRASWYAEGQPLTVNDYAAIRASATGYAIGSSTVTIKIGADCSQIYNTFLQAPGRPLLTVMGTTGVLAFGELSPVGYANFDFVGKAAAGTCRYAYLGQFRDAVTGTNPVIEYSLATGAFVLSGTEL